MNHDCGLDFGNLVRVEQTANNNLNASILPEMTEMPFSKSECEYHEARNYMIALANYFSHLGNYRCPIDPSLCHFISGKADYFYGAEKMTNVENVWNGVKVNNCLILRWDAIYKDRVTRSSWLNENLGYASRCWSC